MQNNLTEMSFNSNILHPNISLTTISSIIERNIVNESVNTTNATTELNLSQQQYEFETDENHEEIIFWILGIYFANIVLGIIFNSISFVALLKTNRNGTLSIITQLTATDVFTSWVCIVELLSLKRSTWSFAAELCPAFSGAEILCNTLTLYLIISLNYHTISLCNLKMNEGMKRDSCDASSECLVRETGSASTTTTSTNIPSTKNKDISIVIPCILIWFACISLSIPQFTLSSTVENYTNKDVTCTLIDVYFGKMLINLLVVFRVFIPVILILCSVCLLTFKLQESLRNDSIPNIFTKKSHNVVYYLIFCLVLNFLFVVTSMQRLILYSMHAFAYGRDGFAFAMNNGRVYKLPPLFNQFTGQWIAVGLCMLHYSGTFLRFLVYYFLLPKFKSILCNNILSCFKRKEL